LCVALAEGARDHRDTEDQVEEREERKEGCNTSHDRVEDRRQAQVSLVLAHHPGGWRLFTFCMLASIAMISDSATL